MPRSDSSVSPNTDVPHCFRDFFVYERTLSYSGHFRPLAAIQVTKLVDIVFIGCTVNHSIVDGTSFWHFFNTLAKNNRGTKKISKSLDSSRDTVFNSPAMLYFPEGGPKANRRGTSKSPKLKTGLFCVGVNKTSPIHGRNRSRGQSSGARCGYRCHWKTVLPQPAAISPWVQEEPKNVDGGRFLDVRVQRPWLFEIKFENTIIWDEASPEIDEPWCWAQLQARPVDGPCLRTRTTQNGVVLVVARLNGTGCRTCE
ncbi:hypothetical protein ACFX1T_043892 [Malus domestica]